MHYTTSQLPTRLTQSLDIRLPVIMAPMFLVSNTAMMKAGMRAGIMSVFPSLNYREEGQLNDVLDECNEAYQTFKGTGSYGVNLIVQNTNIYFKKHLDRCVAKKVPFYITSLGNPAEVISRAREYGGKVYCDVTNLKHAEKVVAQQCDGLIAVGHGAGGHAGSNSLQVLIPALCKEFPGIPIVAAGGISTGTALLSVLALGADGASIGTRFIACTEATVRPEYKEAILAYGMDDIVMTDRISGTPCTVINTPYVQKAGIKQGFIGRWLNKNRRTKKLFKSIVQLKGMKMLEKAAFKATYNTMWCAGQSVETITSIDPVETIVSDMVKEYESSRIKIPAVK
jgi:nitronate monooxygenase